MRYLTVYAQNTQVKCTNKGRNTLKACHAHVYTQAHACVRAGAGARAQGKKKKKKPAHLPRAEKPALLTTGRPGDNWCPWS